MMTLDRLIEKDDVRNDIIYYFGNIVNNVANYIINDIVNYVGSDVINCIVI